MRKHLPLIALAAINALLAIVATYAVLRAYDVLFKAEINPATVAWSAHIAMFWRIGVGSYVAGMVAVLVVIAGRRNLRATTRVTAVLVPIMAALITIQGIFMP